LGTGRALNIHGRNRKRKPGETMVFFADGSDGSVLLSCFRGRIGRIRRIGPIRRLDQSDQSDPSDDPSDDQSDDPSDDQSDDQSDDPSDRRPFSWANRAAKAAREAAALLPPACRYQANKAATYCNIT